MADMKKTMRRCLGFGLIEDQDPLARTHWLILDPSPEDELDDHPPEGPDDDSFREVIRRGDSDYLVDLRVRGCQHRIIRNGEWPKETQTIITHLWKTLLMLAERNTRRQAAIRKMYRNLMVILSSLLLASLIALALLERLSLITLDQFNHAFHIYGYAAVGMVGAIYGIGAIYRCASSSENRGNFIEI